MTTANRESLVRGTHVLCYMSLPLDCISARGWMARCPQVWSSPSSGKLAHILTFITCSSMWGARNKSGIIHFHQAWARPHSHCTWARPHSPVPELDCIPPVSEIDCIPPVSELDWILPVCELDWILSVCELDHIPPVPELDHIPPVSELDCIPNMPKLDHGSEEDAETGSFRRLLFPS